MTHSQALEVLDIQSGASPRKLKSAYRKAARKHHPDKGGDKENFVIVKNAYDLLVKQGTKAIAQGPRYGVVSPWSDPFAGVSMTVSYGVRM